MVVFERVRVGGGVLGKARVCVSWLKRVRRAGRVTGGYICLLGSWEGDDNDLCN